MGSTETTPEQAWATATADGLRHLADMIEANPNLPGYKGGLRSVLLPVGETPAARERIEAYIAAGRASGAEVSEYDSGKYAGVMVKFGAVAVQVYAGKEWLTDNPPPPPPPSYRPLLGDGPTGGAG